MSVRDRAFKELISVYRASWGQLGSEPEKTLDAGEVAKAEVRNNNFVLEKTVRFFRDIFFSMPDLISVVDADLRVVLSNWHRQVFDPYGHGDRPFCFKMYMDKDEPCQDCLATAVFATGLPQRSEKTNPQDGITREILAYPIFDELGRVSMVAEHVRDVSLSKRAANEFHEYRNSLEKLIQQRTRQLVHINEQLRQENFQRRQAEEELKRRDAILEAVSFAAGKLMLAVDWETVIPDVLKQLGEAAGLSRIYVFKHHVGKGVLSTSKLFEWTAPGVTTGIGSEASAFLRGQRAAAPVTARLVKGKPVFGTAEDFPPEWQEELRRYAIYSLAMVPIMIGERLWGVIGCDLCLDERQWSFMEVEALKTAANILGAAIDRQRLEQVVRHSRERFRSVVDDQIEMICRFDAEGNITLLNNSYCQHWGKTWSELIGQPFFPFSCDDGAEEWRRVLGNLDAANPVGTLDYRLVCPERGVRWQQWTCRGIFDRQGGLLEYQAVGLDVTDQKQAEEKLQRVLDEQEEMLAQQASELRTAYEGLIQNEKMATLGLLVSGIAHEINNPNNFISFNMPILRDYLAELIKLADLHIASCPESNFFGMTYAEFREDVFKLLKNIEHGSSRISATVARLKEFVRPQTRTELKPVEPRAVIEQAIEFCSSRMKKSVRSLKLDIPAGLTPIISNPTALEQILINLLINADQSANKEDSWIKIRVFQNGSQPAELVFVVEDNGCGIPGNVLKRIFDPFVSFRKGGNGTGLGLYITRILVEGLGGRIEVESKPGKGSSFRVILPARNYPATSEIG